MVDINTLVGVPFVNEGRSPVLGMDCWGLTMEVFKRFGIELPDFTVDAFAFRQIGQLVDGAIGNPAWEEVVRPVDKDIPLVVLMRMHPVYITHAGVLIKGGRVIHTMESAGVIISKVATLRKTIVGYYRPCLGS